MLRTQPPARNGGERSSNDVVRRNRREKGSRHPEVGCKRVDLGLRGRSGEIGLEEEKPRSKLQEQIEEFGFTPPRALEHDADLLAGAELFEVLPGGVLRTTE